MTTWISYKYAYIPSFLSLSPNHHPTLLVITEHWAELPVLYICFLPAIYPTHGSADMSVLRSQFVPPSASSAVSTRPFSMSASLKSILYVCLSAVHSLCLPLCSPFTVSASLQSILYVCISAPGGGLVGVRWGHWILVIQTVPLWLVKMLTPGEV